MEYWNSVLLAGAALLLISIVASDISSRMGAPLLLVFLALGMLAGEDGPGKIHFDDFEAAYVVGTLALAVIIFDGGLRTRRETFRVALAPAVVLATAGVVITAGLLGAFAAWLLGLGWLEGLLLASIVGSTDAAAVFALLRTQGAALNQRVAATLEIESGSNDPMAVFLTVALLGLIAAGQSKLELSLLWLFAQQFALGALLGLAGGRALAWLINRLTLISGLYPLLAAAGGVLIYALAAQLGGSGFLAIYLAGVVLGNSKLQAAQTIFRVHDGLAWLAQIVMFLLLGLLVTPSQLVLVAGPALAVAAFLMLVARPAAVALCLLPFGFRWREQVYIGWVGLRGAVPIVLALFPMMYGVENAHAYFNVAFFVVLVSLLAQGWTIAPAARRLRLEVPPPPEPLQRVALDVPGHYGQELICYPVGPASLAAGREVASLRLPSGLQFAALVRDDRPQPLSAGLRFQPGDYAWFVGDARPAADIGRLFHAAQGRAHLDEQHYFGEFELSGEAHLDEVAEAYGIAVPDSVVGRSLAEHFARSFHGRPSVGDTLPFGAATLVVRRVEGARVTRVGLRLPLGPEG